MARSSLVAFAVLVWDLLKARTQGWLRGVPIVDLVRACALATIVGSAMAGMALSMAFQPYEAPAGLSELPERTESARIKTTTDETILSETTTEQTASPSTMPPPSASSSVYSSATPYPSASPST